MANVDEDKLRTEIEKILKKADLASTSTKKVRQQLEKTLDCDLSEKRSLIDKLVMNYINSKEDDDQDNSGSEEEEEEEKKPAKRPATKAAKKRKQSTEEEEESEAESESEEEKKKKPAKRRAAAAASSDEASSSDSDSDRKRKGRKGRKNPGSDSEWASAKSKKNKPKKAGGARGKGGGYTRAYKLSPELAELMGAEEMPRHEVVKRVWAIIKQKNLYDPNNKQFTICDDALYKVIGTKRFRTFGMMKYLKPHFCVS